MKRFNYMDRNNEYGHYIPSTLNSKGIRTKSPTKDLSETYNRLYSKEIVSPEKNLNVIRKKSTSSSRVESGGVNLDQVKLMMKNADYKRALEQLKVLKSRSSRNPDISFYTAVCLMAENQLPEAIQELNEFLRSNAASNSTKTRNLHDKGALMLAVAYKRIGELEKSIFFIDKALKINPKFIEGLLYRGKLYTTFKNYDQALNDFERVIALTPRNPMGYLGKADCLRLAGRFEQSILEYNKIIGKGIDSSVFLKRALAFIEKKAFSEAEADLNELIKGEPDNAEYVYYKGYFFYKRKKFQEAIMCLEQSIKNNSNSKVISMALLQILKINLDNRDYYGAKHTLKRFEFLGVPLSPGVVNFETFVTSVIFLMKRKYKEGVAGLTKLMEKIEFSESWLPVLLNYSAYGLYCQGRHQHAYENYVRLEKMGKSSRVIKYNKGLLAGILKSQEGNSAAAINEFSIASSVFTKKMEPHFYTGVTIWKSALSKSSFERIALLKQSLSHFNLAFEKNPSNSTLLYYKGLLNLALENNNEAVVDLDNAIEKSDDNIAIHFYTRGLAYAAGNCFKQAFNDFSIAVKLDESNFARALLSRAKCQHFMGNTWEALEDIYTYSSMKPADSSVHSLAGALFMTLGAADNALKAFSHCEDPDAIVNRYKCNVYLRELNAAIDDIEEIFKHSANPKAKVDYDCLKALKVASSSESEFRLDQAVALLSQCDSEDLSGNIFKRSDIVFYKAIILFYKGEYRKSCKEFQRAWSFKAHAKNIPLEDILMLADDEDNSSRKLESFDKLENASFSYAEYLYNLSIAFIMASDIKKASEIVATLIDFLPRESSGGLKKYMNVLLGHKPESVSFEIEVFPTANRLCSIFEPVRLPLLTPEYTILAKLSFCLPCIEPPKISIDFEESLMSDVSVLVVENKPEAPWIKRSQDHIIFTDKLAEWETDFGKEEDENQDEFDMSMGLEDDQGKGHDDPISFLASLSDVN